MKNKEIIYFLIIFLFSISLLNAQNRSKLDSCLKKEATLYINVDQLPKLQNNENVMEFIYRNIKWPNVLDIEGTIIVSFIVTKYGNICNIEIEKGIFSTCDLEVQRVINLMKNWQPGILNNEPVNVLLYVPIRFSIQ